MLNFFHSQPQHSSGVAPACQPVNIFHIQNHKAHSGSATTDGGLQVAIDGTSFHT